MNEFLDLTEKAAKNSTTPGPPAKSKEEVPIT